MKQQGTYTGAKVISNYDIQYTSNPKRPLVWVQWIQLGRIQFDGGLL
jgi:hypothetical protein